MNWQIGAGIFFLIGGIGNLTQNLSGFVFGISVGSLLLYWGLKKKGVIKLKKKAATVTGQVLHAPSASPQIPQKYIVLDIETTGFSRQDDRIIEIAADEYTNGKISRQFHSYINPERHIPPTITQLTGISDADVKDAPGIGEIKKDFMAFIGRTPLVGHNIVRFDIPFLDAQLGVKTQNQQFDTLDLSKRVFPGLPSYKLSFLDQALHLGGLEHHRASNDIQINNALFLACADPQKYRPFLDDKKTLTKIEIEPKQSFYHTIDIHSIRPSDPNAQPNSPLTGKNIVFSGYFTIPLDKMMQIAVDAGATLKSSISRKVQYLVVGEQDRRFTDENGMTSKQRTATKLIEQGEADIKIINEKTFLELANFNKKPSGEKPVGI